MNIERGMCEISSGASISRNKGSHSDLGSPFFPPPAPAEGYGGSSGSGYRHLLNFIAALPHPLLNKNSSELSLPLLLLHFKKSFWCYFTDVGSILKIITLKCLFEKSC